MKFALFLNGIFAILMAWEGLFLLHNEFQGDTLAILIVLGKYSSNLMGFRGGMYIYMVVEEYFRNLISFDMAVWLFQWILHFPF